MRYFCYILLIALLSACEKTDDQKAAQLMAQIESLYDKGSYREAMDSIVSLRSTYPKAIESRKRALDIWRESSLRLAQEDVAKTDTELQATLRAIDQEGDLYKANMLRLRRDSLQARYEAMCGVVKMINAKKKEK